MWRDIIPITLNNYDASISWSDKTIIYGNSSYNSGLLRNMMNYDLDERINNLEETKDINPVFDFTRGKWTKYAMLQKLYDIQNYINAHPEYYGCSVD